MKKKIVLSLLAFSLMGTFLAPLASTSAQARNHQPNHPQAQYRGHNHRVPPPPPASHIRRNHIHTNYYYYSPHAIIRYNSGYYPTSRGYYDPFYYPPNYFSNFGFSFGVSI